MKKIVRMLLILALMFTIVPNVQAQENDNTILLPLVSAQSNYTIVPNIPEEALSNVPITMPNYPLHEDDLWMIGKTPAELGFEPTLRPSVAFLWPDGSVVERYDEIGNTTVQASQVPFFPVERTLYDLERFRSQAPLTSTPKNHSWKGWYDRSLTNSYARKLRYGIEGNPTALSGTPIEDLVADGFSRWDTTLSNIGKSEEIQWHDVSFSPSSTWNLVIKEGDCPNAPAGTVACVRHNAWHTYTAQDTAVWTRATMWFNSDSMGFSDELIRWMFSHEFGHVLGLNDLDSGTASTMANVAYPYPTALDEDTLKYLWGHVSVSDFEFRGLYFDPIFPFVTAQYVDHVPADNLHESHLYEKVNGTWTWRERLDSTTNVGSFNFMDLNYGDEQETIVFQSHNVSIGTWRISKFTNIGISSQNTNHRIWLHTSPEFTLQ